MYQLRIKGLGPLIAYSLRLHYSKVMVARISNKRLRELKQLLKKQTGKDYSDEEAQEAGMAIIRFVITKEQRKQEQSNR